MPVEPLYLERASKNEKLLARSAGRLNYSSVLKKISE